MSVRLRCLTFEPEWCRKLEREMVCVYVHPLSEIETMGVISLHPRVELQGKASLSDGALSQLGQKNPSDSARLSRLSSHEIIDVELAKITGIHDYSPPGYPEATFALERPDEMKTLSATVFDDVPELVTRA